jgi:putative mRNA 3-end processing factor
MRIHIFGSGQEVGRSAILVESKESGKRILLDCGIKVRDQEMGGATGFPIIPTTLKLDAAIVCHAHLDHSGFVPALADRCLFFSTPPTKGLADLLVKDAKKVEPNLPFSIHDIERAFSNFVLMPYDTEHNISPDFSFTLHDAGHLPGSASVELKTRKKKIAYTSDFKLAEMRLQPQNPKPIEDVDVLIIESTYALREHPDRKDTEKRLVQHVREIVESGGNVLMPAFAVGRTQELALILFAYDVELPVYVDGMGNVASEIILNYPKYVRNPTVLKEAIRNLRIATKDKSIPLKEPSVIIATAGMLEGGPAMSYLLEMDKRFKEKGKPGAVFFSGFCLPETNGWHLQHTQTIYLKKKGKKAKPINIALPNELFHLSAHGDMQDIMTYIKKANPDRIVCVHGDNCQQFAEALRADGWDATAPKNGESIEI